MLPGFVSHGYKYVRTAVSPEELDTIVSQFAVESWSYFYYHQSELVMYGNDYTRLILPPVHVPFTPSMVLYLVDAIRDQFDGPPLGQTKLTLSEGSLQIKTGYVYRNYSTPLVGTFGTEKNEGRHVTIPVLNVAPLVEWLQQPFVFDWVEDTPRRLRSFLGSGTLEQDRILLRAPVSHLRDDPRFQDHLGRWDDGTLELIQVSTLYWKLWREQFALILRFLYHRVGPDLGRLLLELVGVKLKPKQEGEVEDSD